MGDAEKVAPAPGNGSGALEWRTEKRRIGDLVEWEKNPRRLTDKQALALEESLRRFGYVEEIVVNADGRSIIGGHMRRKVALARALLDPGALVDVRVPSRALSEEEGIELAIRLNRNTGEWDFDALANDFEIEALLSWGFDPAEFGMGDLVEPLVAASKEPETKSEVVVEIRCSRADLETFRETLDAWATREAVTVNVAS